MHIDFLSEKTILGHLLSEVKESDLDQIQENYFLFEKNRVIFKEIKRLFFLKKPTDVANVVSGVSLIFKIDKKWLYGYLAECCNCFVSPLNFPIVLKKLKDNFIKQMSLRSVEKFLEKANKKDGDIEREIEELKGIVDDIQLSMDTDNENLFEDAVDFMKRKIPIPDILIEGLLHKETKMILSAPSKAFKSWILLDIAFSIASGAGWLNRKTTQGKVLYINLEVRTPFSQRRMISMAESRGVNLKDGAFKIWNLAGDFWSLDTLLKKHYSKIRDEKFSLVIVDPIYKLLGQLDENSAKDMNVLMMFFEKIVKESGAAVLYAAHFAKGDSRAKTAQDRTSGSGVLIRDPDTIFTVTPTEEVNTYEVDCSLRNFPPIEPFFIERDHPVMRVSEAVSNTHEKALLTLIKDNENLKLSELKKRAKEELGWTSSVLEKYLESAEKKKIIFIDDFFKISKAT